MKRFFSQIMPLACLFFALIGTAGYAQDISEADKKEQEDVLKKDPRDFAANFILGAYYYNLALEPHKETTKMKVIEYLEQGEPFEKKKIGYLKQALPYFENAYAVGKDSDPRVKNVLKDIYQHLGMVRFYRVSPEEVEAQLREKLSKIQFKSMN
ncbi:MAG: hypothetical protein EAZ95_02980 [Bacteroidetes bacterium]|nr:MAG: hypothetical protein EAZ95_02980 [Bacteroidota bacterium]